MIRVPVTRTYTRALAALAAYREAAIAFGPTYRSDNLARHLEALAAENLKLRGEVLRLRAACDTHLQRLDDIKAYVSAAVC